jgi:DNA repair protein RadC
MGEQSNLFDNDEAPASSWPPLTGAAEQVATWGGAVLPDYEVLAAILHPLDAANAAKWSKALLARFGSLPAAVGASYASLAAIVSPRAAVALVLTQETAIRIAKAPLAKRTVLSSWSALLAYVRVALAHETREQFRVIFLDKKNQIIADEVMNRGTVDHAPVYPREVMRRALEVDASALIMVHNHPSGDPTPSGADVDMTRQVIEAGKALRIAVHDHLVVGRDGVVGFKSLGLI